MHGFPNLHHARETSPSEGQIIMTSPGYAQLHSSRNQFEQPASLMQRLLDAIPSHAFDSALPHHSRSYQRHDRHGNTRGPWGLTNIAKAPVALIVLWVIILWWGERSVFRDSIAACDWDKWERWVRDPWGSYMEPALTDRHFNSPKMQQPIALSSSPTHNSSIPILTLGVHGHFRPSQSAIPTSIFGGHSCY